MKTNRWMHGKSAHMHTGEHAAQQQREIQARASSRTDRNVVAVSSLHELALFRDLLSRKRACTREGRTRSQPRYAASLCQI
eukprot:CAMPEP_0183354194 /NCGR_PEP_ID=MMETSP0164_2-20130417/37170_1 /TAXON_ID=221442 /ORGANISM="Coccolithus pelagicus ssp braarudi, Strain PLY182g" /LENGTH=80 /DNA_ID=CAMNT_0025527043 /DNA_START=165 /DNA_END=407 /DNA_ORIENTATION=+